MRGLTRGTVTLLGVAVAGFLLWLASQFDADATGEYWAQIGLVAAAGLTVALSQLLGGWTKWGLPRLSSAVFLLGFLPALVVGGLVVLHAQPDSGSFAAGWAGDLGLGDLAADLAAVVPAIAFGVGLVFGVTFDTAERPARGLDDAVDGVPDREYVAPVEARRSADADEPTLAERRPVPAGVGERAPDPVEDGDESDAAADRRAGGLVR
jgi:hypothetical protein